VPKSLPILIHSFIHSFISNIYIAPLQESYSKALPTPARLKRAVLRWEKHSWKGSIKNTKFRVSGNISNCNNKSLWQIIYNEEYSNNNIITIIRADND